MTRDVITAPSLTRITLTASPLEHARRCMNLVTTVVYKPTKRRKDIEESTRDTVLPNSLYNPFLIRIITANLDSNV